MSPKLKGISTVCGPESDRDKLSTRLKGQTVMLVGRPGVGKTWLSKALLEQITQQGGRAALVSADMGQPSVGVPTCLGLSFEPPWTKPAALWFIGNTAPTGHLLPAVVGTARLVQRARDAGAETVVLDTTGLVEGPAAHVLKYHKVLASRVNQVIGVQRHDELEPLLALLDGICPAVQRLSADPQARDRTPAERRAYRESLYRAHFRGAEVLSFPRDALLGRDWSPAPSSPPSPGAVLGLLDGEGFCLGLGLLEGVARDRLLVYAPPAAADATVRLQVGKLRLSRWSGFTES